MCLSDQADIELLVTDYINRFVLFCFWDTFFNFTGTRVLHRQYEINRGFLNAQTALNSNDYLHVLFGERTTKLLRNSITKYSV